MKKKLFVWLLTCSVLAGLFAVPAFAADDDSIIRLLDEDQGTVDPYAQEWMTATFSMADNVGNLSAKIVNNLAAIPLEVDSLNFIATGPCSDEGGCPYKVDWDGFNANGNYATEGIYELQISASIDDDTDTDIAYITVIHKDLLIQNLAVDKDPVNFQAGDVLTVSYGYRNDYVNSHSLDVSIVDQAGADIKSILEASQTGMEGEYFMWESEWDGTNEEGEMVGDGNYTVVATIWNSDDTYVDTDEVNFAVLNVEEPIPFIIESFNVDPASIDPSLGQTATFTYEFNKVADDVNFYIVDYDAVLESVSMGAVDHGTHVWDGKSVSTLEGTFKGKVVAEYNGESYVEEVDITVVGEDPVVYPCGFPDVAGDHVYCESIVWSKDSGIFIGDPEGNFNPADVINRAEVLAVVMRAFGLDLYDDDGTDLGWSDVTVGAWYMTYLRSGKMYNLIIGDGGATTVRPEEGVNRVEFLKFIMQAGLIDSHDNGFSMESCYDSPFSDVPAEQWFTGYVCKAKELSLFDVYDDLFLPSNGTTRAEVAEALYRMFDEYDWGTFGPPV